jgi:hypothetical protein
VAEKTHTSNVAKEARAAGIIPAWPAPPAPDAPSLEIPKDIGRRLDRYAAELGKEYLFPVSRQQAWERLARTFLPHEGTANAS